MISIDKIPNEILLKIFSHYLATESQRNLLKIISKVCRKWENIALDSCLWKTFDGTLEFPSFRILCKKGVLMNTTHIKFKKSQTTIDSEKLSKIYKNLPCVRKIDFSAAAFTQCFLINLGDKCPELCEIIFCGVHVRNDLKIHPLKLERFFTLRGSKITHLDFSNSYILSPDKMFILVSETCPNLEELLLQNMTGGPIIKFPIELMQNNCRKLKVLRLGWPSCYNMKDRKSCRGFPELEVFTHCGVKDLDLADETLHRLLFMSNKLKVLDIRGCHLLTANAVCSLPATDLERLFISRSRINCTKSAQKLLEKWSHSLVEIDMAKNDLESINDTLHSVITLNGMPKLESLTMSFTKLNVAVLRFVIRNCTNLRHLQLEGCRRIGRCMMRTYHNRQALEELLLKLEKKVESDLNMDCSI